MNPRQRRGVLLVGLAVVGALAVFLSVVNYVSDVQSRVGPMVPVLRLSADAAPYAQITPDMVEQTEAPERWSPNNALTDAVELTGMVSTVGLPAGTVLQQGMLVEPPALQAGEREFAILVDAETGVAGRIGRGSIVDIIATFPSEDVIRAQATIVVENAQILDVGLPAATSEADATGSFSEGQVVPVTFALSLAESVRLAYSESLATDVRLALRAPSDNATIGDAQRTYRPDPGQVGEALPDGGQPDGQAVPAEPPAAPAIPPPAEG